MEYLAQLSDEFGESLNVLTDKIYKMSGREFNINSPKQLAEILFDEMGLKQIKKRSTAVQILEILKKRMLKVI